MKFNANNKMLILSEPRIFASILFYWLVAGGNKLCRKNYHFCLTINILRALGIKLNR